MPPERQDGAADRYLITGGTGFVGRRVLAALTRRGDQCRSLVRREGGGPDTIRADLADKTALTAACYGIESIFHCAGYAHAFSSLSGDDAAMHWRVNFEGTRNLVEAAGQAGVKRFVFLSSVKAMAESGDVCADEDFPGDPGSAYGHAKRAAENAVLDAGQRYGVHVVNLRLAMVHVDDVVSAICLVAKDDRAAGRTYIVASPEAPSGRALFDALRTVQGLPLCTWSVPELVLRSVAKLGDGLESFLKRRLPLDSEALERLLGSAWYSPARIERELGWRAKVSLADGLTEMLRVGL